MIDNEVTHTPSGARFHEAPFSPGDYRGDVAVVSPFLFEETFFVGSFGGHDAPPKNSAIAVKRESV